LHYISHAGSVEFAGFIEAEAARVRADQALREQLHAAQVNDVCRNLVLQLADYSAHVGAYRELAGKAVPPALLREWRVLLLAGKPLEDAARCNAEVLVARETQVRSSV
jgi:hypothetical protein